MCAPATAARSSYIWEEDGGAIFALQSTLTVSLNLRGGHSGTFVFAMAALAPGRGGLLPDRRRPADEELGRLSRRTCATCHQADDSGVGDPGHRRLGRGGVDRRSASLSVGRAAGFDHAGGGNLAERRRTAAVAALSRASEPAHDPVDPPRSRHAGRRRRASSAMARPAIAAAPARVVVIGGGAGGRDGGEYLARRAIELEVTLVEAEPQYQTCFFSNLYLRGPALVRVARPWLRGAAGEAYGHGRSRHGGGDRSGRQERAAGERRHPPVRPPGRGARHRFPLGRHRGLDEAASETCRMPGAVGRRCSCCAGNSKPWRMAACS